MPRPIGVLAVQGGFAAHRSVLQRLGRTSLQIRRPEQLERLDGLVVPGGESTAMLTILRRRAMLEALAAVGHAGTPVLATCAGLILAAHPAFGWLDIGVRRNAYGTQRDSFVARSDDDVHELVFIRAPRIDRVGPAVEVLARYRGEPVLVRQGRVFGATFHPELTPSTVLHENLLACR